MAVAYLELIEGFKEINDALRTEFMPDNSRIEFLKASTTSRAFDTVLTFYSGWFVEYSKSRRSSKIELATNEPFDNDTIVAATHIKINEDVYTIDQGETIQPQGTDPLWTFYCERFAGKAQFTAIV